MLRLKKLRLFEVKLIDKNYIKLFQTLAQAAEILAERVAEYDEKNNEPDKKRSAEVMREDFAHLNDKLSKADEATQLTRGEFIKLLVASYIVSNNLKIQIEQLQKTLDNYQVLIIPKLSRINDESKSDDEAMALANELFGKIEN